MPLDLPGFYWDESKNRYFPLASKPKCPLQYSVKNEPLPAAARTLSAKREKIWEATERIRTTCSRSHRERATHAVLSSQVASTSRADHSRIPVLGIITTFGTTNVDGRRRSFIGDDQGWLYSHTPCTDGQSPARWFADLTVQPSSEISSICISGSRCVATSSGPACKFLVRDLDTERASIFCLRRQGPEIWSSHLKDRSLVLGTKSKAAYIQDIEQPPSVRYLDTQSDVFSVHQSQEELIFTGSRNGSIHRFDTRVARSHGQKLFNARVGNQRVSVRYLSIIRDLQLVASQSNGDLGIFDLRFPRESHPQMVFPGHVDSINGNTPRLGVTIDPSEDFIFAAGQDGRIRAWSLRTGTPLHAPSPPSPAKTILPPAPRPPSSISDAPINSRPGNLLTTIFESPVVALQITEERAGTCLWAASGNHLYQFYLGQHAHSIADYNA